MEHIIHLLSACQDPDPSKASDHYLVLADALDDAGLGNHAATIRKWVTDTGQRVERMWREDILPKMKHTATSRQLTATAKQTERKRWLELRRKILKLLTDKCTSCKGHGSILNRESGVSGPHFLSCRACAGAGFRLKVFGPAQEHHEA